MLFRRYRYLLKKSNKTGTKYWRCQRGCPATLTTDNNSKTVIKVNGIMCKTDNVEVMLVESHENCQRLMEPEVASLKSYQEMIKRVEKSSEPIERIFLNEQSKLADQIGDLNVVTDVLRSYGSCKSALYRRRNAVYPPLPSTLTELDISNTIYCKT